MIFLRYKENITTIKYSLIFINVFFMILAIRALINNQTIIESINQVKEETYQTQERTYYTKNFLIPYLQSDFAPYFFAHENNQIFPGERIIRIITLQNEDLPELYDISGTTSIVVSNNTGTQTTTGNPHHQQQRNRYLSTIFSSIRIGRVWIPFLVK